MMDKKSILILGGIVGFVCGLISPFIMQLFDKWIVGIGIVVIISCLIGVIGGLIGSLILKNKEFSRGEGEKVDNCLGCEVLGGF